MRFFKALNVSFVGLFLLFTQQAFAKAELSASTLHVVFENVPVGTTSTQRVIITNIGDRPVESINYTTNCGFDFYNQDSSCVNGDLMPKKSCYYDITYRPYDVSYSQCLAEVHSNNGHIHILIDARSIESNQ